MLSGGALRDVKALAGELPMVPRVQPGQNLKKGDHDEHISDRSFWRDDEEMIRVSPAQQTLAIGGMIGESNVA